MRYDNLPDEAVEALDQANLTPDDMPPLTLEPNGHTIKGIPLRFKALLDRSPEQSISAVLTAFANSKLPLSTYVPVGTPSEYYSRTCFYCGKSGPYETNGVKFRPSSQCAATTGHSPEFTLAVPSGIIVASDSLYPVFDVNGYYTIEHAPGQIEYTHAMAAIGCAWGQVLDSDPDIYRVGPDRYQVVELAYDPVQDKAFDISGDRLGHIVTDTWSYCIADADDYDRRRSQLPGHVPVDDPITISIRPGTYRFTNHMLERNFNPDDTVNTIVFADFHWIGPA